MSNSKILNIFCCLRSQEHWSYYETILQEMVVRGYKVYLLFSKGRSNAVVNQRVLDFVNAHKDNVSWGWMEEQGPIARRFLHMIRELRSYVSYLLRPEQDDFYRRRWQGRLPWFFRVITQWGWVNRLLGSKQVLDFLERIEHAIAPAKKVVTHLREENPDLVFATPMNMHGCFAELEYVKAAKALNILTTVLVLSWDNLTTKGLYHIKPDLLLTWHETHRQEAIDVHGIAHDHIVTVGSPFLDKWFLATDKSFSADDLLTKMNIKPGAPVILYLGSSVNIAKDETWLVTDLAKQLRESSDPILKETVILARPHGGNQEVYKNIDEPNVRVWIRDKDKLPDTPQAFAEFRASLDASYCVMGLNTTGMVDAVIYDKPVVALMVKEYSQTNASQAEHFRYIVESGVYDCAATTQEALVYAKHIYDGKDGHQAQRKAFVDTYIHPCKGEALAGELSVEAMEHFVSGKNAQDISEFLKDYTNRSYSC